MARLANFEALLNPVEFARSLGFHPDPWQATVLHPAIRHGILCCSRQSGKTTAVAYRAAFELTTVRGSQVLIVSATENHAAEIALRIKSILQALHLKLHKQPGTGRPHDYLVPHSQSRFLALPCTESAARTFTATLILIDEAARVPDKVWYSLTGTQAAVWDQASCWLLSTPKGRTGFFHDLYTGPDPLWTRLSVPATQCPRISQEFLDQKQRELPPWIFQQDYLCQFGDSALSVFKDEDIQAALNPPPELPNKLTSLPKTHYYLGLDLGQSVNHSALVVLESRAIPKGQRDPYTYQDLYEFQLRVKQIERLPLELPYTEIIQRLHQIVHLPEYVQQITIVLDATGGNVFLDHLRAARLGVQIIPVIMTTGHQATEQNGKHHVPKHDLVTNLEALFRERRIWLQPHPSKPHPTAPFHPTTPIPPTVPDHLANPIHAGRKPGYPSDTHPFDPAPTPARQRGDNLAKLIKELQAFQRLPTLNGREQFSGKATAQDDLVIALALAAWRAVKSNPTLNHNKGIWGTQRLL